MKHAKRHPLIFGTLILTITGLITRIIGFFYRIYLSRLFGEEGMGIYQLLSPALSLSFSLTATRPPSPNSLPPILRGGVPMT